MKTIRANTNHKRFPGPVDSLSTYDNKGIATIANTIPSHTIQLVRSFRSITDNRIVRAGDNEMIGNIMYAGPMLSAFVKRINWPPAPVNPIIRPRMTDFLEKLIRQLILLRPKKAGISMVTAQTEKPRVAVNPFFSGISIRAPQIPQNKVVTKAYASQMFDCDLCIRYHAVF